jgi:hypothetical protein
MAYPFVRNALRAETLTSRFNNMRRFHPRVLTVKQQPLIDNLDQELALYQGKFQLLVEPMASQVTFTELVDVFQEEQVIHARWSNYPSLAETFEEHQEELQELGHDEQRRRRELCKPISRFRPTTLVALIKMFKPKCILDPCAYSDRLKCYCGIDPNAALHLDYQAMIDFFAPRSERDKYRMIKGCAEEVDYLEVYVEDDKRQSMTRYHSLEEWYQHFLLSFTQKAVRKLSSGGYLVRSLNDKPEGADAYVERLVRELSAMATLHYEVVLHVTTDLSYEHARTDGRRVEGCQPLWVWRKVCKKIEM